MCKSKSMSDVMEALFDEDELPEKSRPIVIGPPRYLLDGNRMVRKYHYGPEGAKCSTCAELMISQENERTSYYCSIAKAEEIPICLQGSDPDTVNACRLYSNADGSGTELKEPIKSITTKAHGSPWEFTLSNNGRP